MPSIGICIYNCIYQDTSHKYSITYYKHESLFPYQDDCLQFYVPLNF